MKIPIGLNIKMPEAPPDEILENYSPEMIWQLGFKEGIIAYELALKHHHARQN